MGFGSRIFDEEKGKLIYVFIGCLVESYEESMKFSQFYDGLECEEVNEYFQNSEVMLRIVGEVILGDLIFQFIFMVLVTLCLFFRIYIING